MYLWVLSFIGMSALLATADTQQLLSISQQVAQWQTISKQPAMLVSPTVKPVAAKESAPKAHSPIAQMETFAQQVADVWGEDTMLSSPTVLAQYSHDKHTRAIIDLTAGKLVIEQLDSSETAAQLKQLLAYVLLTPDDPTKVDSRYLQPTTATARPFLYGQLVDTLGQPINTWEKAQNFAAWAVDHRLERIETPQGVRQRIELALDANHKQVRAARFAIWIEQVAQTFGLDSQLLYAIIETESQFNPFAVSHAGALGLMQIIPDRAGRDAMAWLGKGERTPSTNALLDPQTNIQLGAAYLAMLSQRYFKDIQDPRSKEYAMIAAYNGGMQRVIRIFSDRQHEALRTINALAPQMVYDAIRQYHSRAETRDYVKKVTTAKHRYQDRV